jgi:DinB superfamily
MNNARISAALMFALFAIPGSGAAQSMAQPKTYTLSAELASGYRMLQGTLADAAEKMPDEHYGFKPTPAIKPFGQLVAHVALAQFRTCAMLKGEPSPRKDEKEDAMRTKADAIALLKASTAYCDPLVSGLTDAAMGELTRAGDNQVAKGLFPAMLISHGMEMYGTMAVYLRLKDIVPPTTEKQNQQMQKKNSQ